MSDQVTTNAVCRCGHSFGERVYTGEGHHEFGCPSCGRVITVAVTRDSRGNILYQIGIPR